VNHPSTPHPLGRLVCENVVVRYERPGAGAVHALRGVSVVLAPGEYAVVIGANGAGKSTLVNAVCGDVAPTSGKVTLDETRMVDLSDFKRSQAISRVHQDPAAGVCGELTIEENMALGLTKGKRRSIIRPARRKSRLAAAREILAHYGRGLEGRLSQPANTLSGGQRQLVALSMAMAHAPRLLLLDEHTSALDPAIGLTVMQRTDELIRETGITTLMVTHNMRHAARYGDRLLIMANGQIVCDVHGRDKHDLGEDGLIELFRSSVADQVTDRLLA
jgi:putative ABC transport system ATP-binding protein